MSSTILRKPAGLAPSLDSAHPFEASVRTNIAALRGQLTQLKQSGTLDAFGKSQVKNLEAQLGKKNAYLASIVQPSAERPVAIKAAASSADPGSKAPAAKHLSKASATSMLSAPEQSFGALGARLKGRLAPGLGLQLDPGVPPEGERF